MQKQAPSLGRVLTMVVFALSCFGILMFLWLSFGGPLPLKPEGYRFKAAFPEAATLAQEADVRIAGVNVGKVKKKQLVKSGAVTEVELELVDEYAPIPEDSRAILRQKTLLGETYVELSPGSPQARPLREDGTLSRAQVEPTVELDEILRIFDPETKEAFRAWQRGTAGAIEGGTGEALNDALGNLAGFSQDGAEVLRVLDEQRQGLKLFIKNTGVVFGAINEREGELQELIKNSSDTFEATAQAKEALAESFEILPTFLDESKKTAERLERFSRNTHPLVRDLRPAARDLGPTVQDLGALAPDLRQLFIDLRPISAESGRTLPAGARLLRGFPQLFEGLHAWLPEFNPIVSFANFQQDTLAGFLSNGSAGLVRPSRTLPGNLPVLNQLPVTNDRSLALAFESPEYERGNAYLEPNAYARARVFGALESWNCVPDPRDPGNDDDGEQGQPDEGLPPCFVEPDSLWDGEKYPRIQGERAPLAPWPRGTGGEAPLGPVPRGNEGTDGTARCVDCSR